MAGPVMVRPLSEGEDRELLRVVRGVGRQDAALRWALIVRASADRIAAPLIARVLDADADHVRDVIHAFNANGLTALDPRWGPGPRRRITPTDEASIVLSTRLDRCFAFDQFGPLSIRPCHGTCWAARKHPDRLPATYHRTHGIRYFHGCYDLSQDRLWGITRLHKGGTYTLAALKHPGGPSRRQTDLRHPRQPVGEQDPRDPGLGRPASRRVVPHPDQRLLGRPDRSTVRSVARLRDRQLRPPQPPRPGPRHPGLPALAQHPQPRPRAHRGATPRTHPGPQRTPPTLGPTTTTAWPLTPTRPTHPASALATSRRHRSIGIFRIRRPDRPCHRYQRPPAVPRDHSTGDLRSGCRGDTHDGPGGLPDRCAPVFANCP